MKKNKGNFLYRLRVFVLALLFIFPCFAFLGCDTGGGSSNGNGLNIPTYTDPLEKGMVELSPSDGISLKYLYKPQDLSPYYEKIKNGILNSAENTIVNLVGEYGVDEIVEVYNEEYTDVEPLKTALSPFETTGSSTLSQLFNGVTTQRAMRKNLAKAKFAYYDTENKWYAIGSEDIPENFIVKDESGYKISYTGNLIDLSNPAGAEPGVTAGDAIAADATYSFTRGEAIFYLWVGNATNIVSSTGGKAFTEKLVDTHYNAINRNIKSVDGENGAIEIKTAKWAWSLEEWETATFLEAYLEEYKGRLAIEMARIIAYGTGELTGNTKVLYATAIANPKVKAEEFVEDCVLRIDHIGISSDEADLITDYIVNNVIGEEVYNADKGKYSYSGGNDSDKYYANEIADGTKRVLVTVDEETGKITYNNTIVIDETVGSDIENGFRRTALFKNYYNTTRASLERTRLVFPEIPIVDYVDVAFNANNEDVFDISYEEPANGKIQSIVITNTNSTDLQIGSLSFMITSVHDESKANWTVDTLDIYIYANYYHNGEFQQFSLDSMYLSKLEPTSENGIGSDYGTLIEKTYNIYDTDDSPAFIGKELVLSPNTHTELDTEDWGGLKDNLLGGNNAGDIDKKNSVTENTFKNFKSVNYGFGNSAAYNGGGDYLEICFVVDGKDATLLDYYNYSIVTTAIYGKSVK